MTTDWLRISPKSKAHFAYEPLDPTIVAYANNAGYGYSGYYGLCYYANDASMPAGLEAVKCKTCLEVEYFYYAHFEYARRGWALAQIGEKLDAFVSKAIEDKAMEAPF